MRRRGLATAATWGTALLIAACGPSPTGSESGQPSASPGATSAAVTFVGQHLGRDAEPIVQALADHGYECGPSKVNARNIECEFPPGVVEGWDAKVWRDAEDALTGVAFTSPDLDLVAAVLATLTSDPISTQIVSDLDAMAGLNPPCRENTGTELVPCPGRETFGNVEAAWVVDQDSLYTVWLFDPSVHRGLPTGPR